MGVDIKHKNIIELRIYDLFDAWRVKDSIGKGSIQLINSMNSH